MPGKEAGDKKKRFGPVEKLLEAGKGMRMGPVIAPITFPSEGVA